MISQLDGFIEQLMTAEGVNKARWWMRSLFRVLTPAIGFAYVVVAMALSGRSLSAMNDYYKAWLFGVILQQLLGVVECYVVYNMVSRCGLCTCCMPKDGGEAAKDRDTELGDIVPSTVVATQPGLSGNDPNDLPSVSAKPPGSGDVTTTTTTTTDNNTPLQQMLVELGLLDEVADAFADEGIETVETLDLYSQAELEGVGIKRGHAKRLLAQCAAVSAKPPGSGDVTATTTVANTAFTSASPARKMKAADDANARCPKCASKMAFCICNDAETRRMNTLMSTKCEYASGARTCSKPAMKTKSYCVFHTCKHQGCPTPKSSKVEYCPEHADTQA